MKRIFKIFTVAFVFVATLNFVPVAAHDNGNNNHNCNVNNDGSGNHYDADKCNTGPEVIYVEVEVIKYVNVPGPTVYVDKEVIKEVPVIEYRDREVVKFVDKLIYVNRPVEKIVEKIVYVDKIVEKEVIKEVIVEVEKEDEEELVVVEEEEISLVAPVCVSCCLPWWLIWGVAIAALTGLINFVLLLLVMLKRNKVVTK